MIYFTTFILTLLLSHIARATPACDDVAPPEELYDPTFADAQGAQHAIVAPYNVTWSGYYDNPNGDTKKVVCNGLARRYPHFKNFPDYPYIGGVFNIKKGSQNNCGECWRLTYARSKRSVYITAIDSDTNHGFNISKTAYNVLSGGLKGSKSLLAEATPAPPHFCAGRKE